MYALGYERVVFKDSDVWNLEERALEVVELVFEGLSNLFHVEELFDPLMVVMIDGVAPGGIVQEAPPPEHLYNLEIELLVL